MRWQNCSTNRQLSGRRSLRNSESRRDARGQAGVESRSDGTPANHKTNLNPEQSERVPEAIATQ